MTNAERDNLVDELDKLEKELDQQYGMATATQLWRSIQITKALIESIPKQGDVPSRD